MNQPHPLEETSWPFPHYGVLWCIMFYCGFPICNIMLSLPFEGFWSCSPKPQFMSLRVNALDLLLQYASTVLHEMQCVSVSGHIPGTERPIATKFRRQPRRKVLYTKLSTIMTHINITPYTKVTTYWATKKTKIAPRVINQCLLDLLL